MEASTRQGGGEGTADQAKEKVSEAAEQAKDKASEVAGQAGDRVRDFAGEAQQQARTQIDQRSTEAGERVTGTADDLRSVGEELRNQGKEGPAKIADQAADRIERAGSYLRDSDADRLLHDAEDFGRRRPWAVLAGGVVLGVAAARVLRASARDRYATRDATGGYGSVSTDPDAAGFATSEQQTQPIPSSAEPAGVR
jgi:uncharacterized protein YjbJ (UPF0337 family)